MRHQASLSDLALKKGMPADLTAERFILGSILLDGPRLPEVAGTVRPEDFALEAHRRIYSRILSLDARGEKIDRATLANELNRYGELESVGGLSAIVSLDEGLPHITNLDSYCRLVRDKSALRTIAVASQQLMNRALLGEESPDEILAGAEETLLGISETRHTADDGLMQAGEFLRGFPGGFNAFAEPARRENGLRTGFAKFDDMTGGLRKGELVILAARPGVGKTAWAMGVAWQIAARQNVPVGVFSLEMSRESLLLRLLCAAARIDSQRLRAGYLTAQEREKIVAARQFMLDAPLFIDDASNIGLMELHAKVRRLERKRKVKLGLIVVDFIQLMATRGKADNRSQEVSRLARGLKLLAKADQLDVPILALSQISRASETRQGDKRPQLSDLKESGGLEENADIVGALFREEMYRKDREDLRGLAELILLKSRSGPVGTINLLWLHALTKFENMAEDLPQEPEDSGRLPYAD